MHIWKHTCVDMYNIINTLRMGRYRQWIMGGCVARRRSPARRYDGNVVEGLSDVAGHYVMRCRRMWYGGVEGVWGDWPAQRDIWRRRVGASPNIVYSGRMSQKTETWYSATVVILGSCPDTDWAIDSRLDLQRSVSVNVVLKYYILMENTSLFSTETRLVYIICNDYSRSCVVQCCTWRDTTFDR